MQLSSPLLAAALALVSCDALGAGAELRDLSAAVEPASRWVGGFTLFPGIHSDGLMLGVHLTARYRFVQAGYMGFLGWGGEKLSVGTLGVAVDLGKFDVAFEGLLGAHAIDHDQVSSRGLLGGSNCRIEGPVSALPHAGFMLTFSRALRQGGGAGFSVFAGGDLTRRTVAVTKTCTHSGFFTDRNQTTTETVSDTAGGVIAGGMLRLSVGLL